MSSKWILSLALLATDAFAGDAPSGHYSEACRCDTRDVYDLGPVMPRGKYQGQCQNNCVQRTIILPEGGPSQNTLFVANVRHGEHFYSARFPLDEVKDAFLQIVFFPAPLNIPAGHIQARFRFERPIELVPQVPGLPSEWTNDFIFSAESNAPDGVKFDVVFEGLGGDYVLAYRVRTVDEFFAHGIFQVKPPIGLPIPGIRGVAQYKMKLLPTEKRALLERALEYGAAMGNFQIYNSLFKSCATELFFGVIDPAVPSHNKKHLHKWLVRYPVWNAHALSERGILDGRVADLTDEMNCRAAGGSDDECLVRH